MRKLASSHAMVYAKHSASSSSISKRGLTVFYLIMVW